MPPDAFLNTGQGLLALDVGAGMDLTGGCDIGTGDNGNNGLVKDASENKQQILFADQLFGGQPVSIDLMLVIVSTRTKRRERIWEGFVTDRVLFLRGNNLETIELRER
jgi:hypothetical protein